MKFKVLKAISIGLVLCVSSFANATLILGDFRTESNLPGIRTGSALVYQSLGQSIGAGYELDSGDFLENPDNWGGGVVWMDFDADTGILLLDSQDTWDFYTFDALISNISFDIAGEFISGVSMLTNNLVTGGFVPTISFTDNSLSIAYSGDPLFNFTAGTATFQVTTSVAQSSGAVDIPEPSSLTIFALGVFGLVSRKLRKS